ncbi:MAG: hypothetical protein GY719_35300 [bacterium]|nr:hypothetical protein [bacterium]
MSKRWSKAELAHLKRYAESQSLEELAQRFHTDTESVRQKLEDLGLAGAGTSSADAEAALASFQEALELLHQKKWAKAAKLLEKTAAAAEDIHLADRARQHLEICRQQTDKTKDDADPYLRAVFEKNRGNLDEALALCKKQRGAAKEERYAYLMASIQALSGSEDEALTLLEDAIRLEPKNRVHAYHDPDFLALHGREEFTQLVQAP